MDPSANHFDHNSGLLMVLLAGIGIYIAARFATDAVVAGRRATGMRLAVGQWLPIGVAAIWAASSSDSRGNIAMGIVFGTAVGSVLLAAGAAVMIAPPRPVAGGRFLWSMLVPVGIAAFFSGFSGTLPWWNALGLAIEGLVILAAVLPRAGDTGSVPVVVERDEPASITRRRSSTVRWAQFVLAGGVAAVAAWMGIHGVERIITETGGRATPGLLTSILLCPLLVLPSVGAATDLAQRGKSAEVLESAVWTAIGNICFLAPVLLVAGRIGFIVRNRAVVTKAYTVGNPIPFPDLLFPVTVWRIDVLFLIAVGLLLLPVAAGRWPLTKRHGLGMTIAYGIYLFLPIYKKFHS